MLKRMIRTLFALAFLCLPVVPLRAQIDPNWRTNPDIDVLDVFKVRGGKSEVMCLLDFSGSMSRLMWHPYYYTGKAYRTNFTTRSTSTAFTDDDIVYFEYKLSYSNSEYRFNVSTDYLNQGSKLFYDIKGTDSSGNALVDSQGRLITQTLLTTSVASGGYGLTASACATPSNWTKYATHMRLTGTSTIPGTTASSTSFTFSGGVVANKRTIDIPFPWKLFNSPSSVVDEDYSVGFPNASFVYSNYSEEWTYDEKNDPSHSKKIYLDTASYVSNVPDATGTNYDAAASVSPTTAATTSTSRTGQLQVGGTAYVVNTDYLYWIFFGTGGSKSIKNDVAQPTGMTTGRASFAIPEVTQNNAKGRLATAWENGLPVKCRYQALKAALLKVYFGQNLDGTYVQDSAYWAFRYLDTAEDGTANSRGTPTSLGTLSRDNNIGGTSNRTVRLLSADSQYLANLKDLQGRSPSGGTPMTWGIANTLLQYNATVLGNGRSVFDPVNNKVGGVQQPPALCGKNFLLLATDGVPNEAPDPAAAVYYGGTSNTPNSPLDGNTTILNNMAQIDPTLVNSGAKFWNPETLAGIAAHGSDKNKVIPLGSGSGIMSKYAPFQITARGTSTGLSPRAITCFAIGISQGGCLSEAGSPQRRLNAFALWGNPSSPTGSGTFTPDPLNPAPSSNFANAQSDTALRQALVNLAALTNIATASYTAPSVPYIGTRLGNTTYMGLFHTVPQGPRWYGDLLMAGLQDTTNGALFVDKDGNQTDNLSKDNAVWAASDILQAYGTSDKRQGKVYTLIPKNGVNTFVKVAPEDTTGFLTDLQNAIPAATRPTLTNLNLFLWSMLGGDTGKAKGSTAGSYPMRLDDQGKAGGAMGDVINSNPAVVEYPLTAATDSDLSGFGSGYGTDPVSGKSTVPPKFRVIFVSSNQGHIHAFGEVSYTYTQANGTIRPKAKAIELWSFIPTESILSPWYLDNKTYQNVQPAASNPHVYQADGTPFVYFDDKPVNATSSVGNGMVDGADTAYLVFGLGKGGRSYYCLDIKDPYNPKFVWALRPDDVTTSAGSQVVRTMGLSTCLPAIARAIQGSAVKDFLVLGGGFSRAEIEANAFPAGQFPTTPPALGRSVLAFDIYQGPGAVAAGSGNLLTWTDASMGAVTAGVMPFEFYPGSYMTQRIYFNDRSGHIWAIGNLATNAQGNRAGMDSSDVAKWGLRKALSTGSTTVISTLPEVFGLTNGVIPSTNQTGVGVVYGTGDRQNPMDFPAGSAGVIPGAVAGKSVNRVGLLFDTNDPSMDSSGRPESSLADLTTAATASDADPFTYLAVDSGTRKPTKFGWVLTLGKNTNFYDKIINSSLVINNVLFFSVFTPQNVANDPCAGAGVTNTYRMANVSRPIFNNGNQQTDWSFDNLNWVASSGKVRQVSFQNLASDVSPMGNTQTLQAGQDPNGGGTTLHQIMGKGIPIGLRMRAWRIVR